MPLTERLVDRGERAADRSNADGLRQRTGPSGIRHGAGVLNAEGYRRHSGALATPPGLQVGARIRGRWPVPRSGAQRPDPRCQLLKLRDAVGALTPRVGVSSSWPCAHAHGLSLEARFRRWRTRTATLGACRIAAMSSTDLDGEPINPVNSEAEETRRQVADTCASGRLWTLIPSPAVCRQTTSPRRAKAAQRIPTIGEKSRRRS